LQRTGRAHAQDSTQVWSLGVDNQSGIYVGIALSPRFRLEPDGAFDLLRRAARSSRRKLHDLAADVVRWRETPQEIMQLVVQPPPERTR